MSVGSAEVATVPISDEEGICPGVSPKGPRTAVDRAPALSPTSRVALSKSLPISGPSSRVCHMEAIISPLPGGDQN